MKNKKPIFSQVEIVIIIVAGLLVLALWVFSPFYLKNHFVNIVERGQFGDSFGVITSLFNAFAFYALAVTLIMQRRELSYQREEFEQSRMAQQDLVKENENNVNLQILLSHTSYLKTRADQIGETLRQVITIKGDGGRVQLMSLDDITELNEYFTSTKINRDRQTYYTELIKEYSLCITKYHKIQNEFFSEKANSILESDIFSV